MNPDQQPQQNTTTGLGRSMMLGGWVLGLLLLALVFGDLLESGRNPNSNIIGSVNDAGIREVVLERNRNGHYLTGGQINGQTVEFLLDTGASDVSVPAPVARRLQLERGIPLTYNTANGPITAYHTRLSRLSIGNIELYDVNASINPHMEGDTILLGMSFLRHLEFTQRDNSLIIRQHP